MDFFSNSQGIPLDQWLDARSAQLERENAQAKLLTQRLSTLTTTASVANGAVEASVDSAGALTDLRLSPRVQQWHPKETAQYIMAAVRQAQANLTQQLTDLVRETVGVDSMPGRLTLQACEARFSAAADGPQSSPGRSSGTARR